MCEEDRSLGKKFKGNVQAVKNNVSLNKSWLGWEAWTGLRLLLYKCICNRMSPKLSPIPRSPILRVVTTIVNKTYVKNINTGYQLEWGKSGGTWKEADWIFGILIRPKQKYGKCRKDKNKTKRNAESNSEGSGLIFMLVTEGGWEEQRKNKRD